MKSVINGRALGLEQVKRFITPAPAVHEIAGLSPELEHISIILNHLSAFALAGKVLSHAVVQATTSGPQRFSCGREKAASGGPNQPLGVVEQLARCTTSRCAVRLANGLIWHHQMIQYDRNML